MGMNKHLGSGLRPLIVEAEKYLQSVQIKEYSKLQCSSICLALDIMNFSVFFLF